MEGSSGGVPLGGERVAVRRMIVYPAAAVDVSEGSPTGPPQTHTIRVVLISEGEALLLPCDRRYLENLYGQLGRLLHKEGVTHAED